MLNDYLNLIQAQRIKNPLHQKDYRLINLPKQNNSYTVALEELNKFPTAFFSNIIERTEFLYTDVADNYYYEFIDKGLGYNTDLKDWRYIYIPLSKYNLIISRLPSFKLYDIENTLVIQEYKVTSNILYINNIFNIDYLLNTSKEHKHPLAPHFIFTGGATLLKNGRMIYEYKDTIGYTDDNSISYLSTIEPLNLLIYSSYLQESQFYYDTIFTQYINKPPNKLNLYSSVYRDLQFTGRVTNQLFSKYKKWFEYFEYEDGFPSNQIILPYPPTNKSLDLIKINAYNKQLTLNLNTSFGTQYTSINQISSNKQINIT